MRQRALDYIGEFKTLTLIELASTVLIGALFAICFVFLSPGRSISTLMHDVLELPGPGAGIALLVGPVGILCGLLAYSLNPRPGIILFSVIVFGIITPIGGMIFNPDGLGQFSFLLPFASFVILAIFLEALVHLLGDRADIPRMGIPSVIVNVLFLVFWWLAIFPLYLDRWPVKKQVEVETASDAFEYLSPALIMIGMAVVGAVLIGVTAPLIIRIVKRRKDGYFS